METITALIATARALVALAAAEAPAYARLREEAYGKTLIREGGRRTNLGDALALAHFRRYANEANQALKQALDAIHDEWKSDNPTTNEGDWFDAFEAICGEHWTDAHADEIDALRGQLAELERSTEPKRARLLG